jgi:cell division protein FtsQ
MNWSLKYWEAVMSARRKQQKRKARVDYRRWYGPLVLAALVAGGWQLTEHVPDEIMPIDKVQIEGAFVHLSQEDIRNQLKQALTGDYFTADIEAIRNALLLLPWVQDASIRRQWPSTLQIRITEKQAVAYWSDDSLLSDRGDLFKPEQVERDMQIPHIKGPEGLHHKVWAFLVRLHAELSGLGLDVDRLVLDERRSWSMLLSNGVELQLGRNDTETRIQRFIRVFSMQNAPNIDDVEYIDLRYPNGFALKNKASQSEKNNAGLDNISGWKGHA